MKNIKKILLGLAVLALLVLVVKFVPNNRQFAFPISGITDACFQNCNYDPYVQNIYTGIGHVASMTSKIDYGGAISPLVCVDGGIATRCGELDVTKLSDYNVITRTIVGKETSFGNYFYLGLYAISEYQQKIYFLYRLSSPQIADSAFDEPVKIVSFDAKTKIVTDEGQIAKARIEITDMHISPRGNYIIIIDTSNISGVTVYDLKNKRTLQNIIPLREGGGNIEFVDWIDDTTFIYKIIKHYDKSNEVAFEVGKIK